MSTNIASFGGMTKYLNATKAVHNNIDAKALKKYWNWGKEPHYTVKALAEMCGVSRQQMDHWLDLLHQEAGIERPRRAKKN